MTELHDGHSNHFEGCALQQKPTDYSTSYLRAITLNKNQYSYPDRVRVITPCAAIHDAIEAKESML